MVSTRTPCSFYAHYIVAMWILCGFHVHTMWFQGGHHLVSRLTQCGFQVDNTGFQKWILCGFYRTPQGFHMDAIWTPCVVEVTTWKPAQKKQLCMKPTGFLVISCLLKQFLPFVRVNICAICLYYYDHDYLFIPSTSFYVQ